MAKRASQGKTVKITLVKSPIGYAERQRRTLRALGLSKVQQTVEQPDTPAVRGMVAKLSHLVEVNEAG